MKAAPDSPHINLHLFGALADYAIGVPPQLILPNKTFGHGAITGAALIELIALSYPELGTALRAPGIRLALNKALCPMNSLIKAGDEVAFMSPLSGG